MRVYHTDLTIHHREPCLRWESRVLVMAPAGFGGRVALIVFAAWTISSNMRSFSPTGKEASCRRHASFREAICRMSSVMIPGSSFNDCEDLFQLVRRREHASHEAMGKAPALSSRSRNRPPAGSGFTVADPRRCRCVEDGRDRPPGGPREWQVNGCPLLDFQAFHGRFHSPTIRRTVAENGPCHFSGRL